MIKCFILAAFFIVAHQLLKLAEDYGIGFDSPTHFAAFVCIAFIALTGIAKIITR